MVYEEIYRAMLTDRLGPGDRLNRREVAEDLGVSVAPVLEAMTQLEWEGFLATTPRRGTIVREVTFAEVLGRFHLRSAIESQAARIYAGDRIRAEASRMRELAAAVDETRQGTLETVDEELRFHHALVDLSGCRILSESFRQVMRHSLYYAAQKIIPREPEPTERMHIVLVEKLLESGPEEADRLIRHHLQAWIEVLTKAAAEKRIEGRRLDARGETTRIKARRKAPQKSRDR